VEIDATLGEDRVLKFVITSPDVWSHSHIIYADRHLVWRKLLFMRSPGVLTFTLRDRKPYRAKMCYSRSVLLSVYANLWWRAIFLPDDSFWHCLCCEEQLLSCPEHITSDSLQCALSEHVCKKCLSSDEPCYLRSTSGMFALLSSVITNSPNSSLLLNSFKFKLCREIEKES
jgi:hypothetical protein